MKLFLYLFLLFVISGCNKNSDKVLYFEFYAKDCTVINNDNTSTQNVYVVTTIESIAKITYDFESFEVQFLYEDDLDNIKFVGLSSGYINKNGDFRIIYGDYNITGKGAFTKKNYY